MTGTRRRYTAGSPCGAGSRVPGHVGDAPSVYHLWTNGRVRGMDEPKLSAEDVAAVIETYERLRTHAGLSQEEAKRETLESFANRATYERYLAEGLSEDEALWQTWKNRHKDE